MTDHDRDFASYRFSRRELPGIRFNEEVHIDRVVFWCCVAAVAIVWVLDWVR